MLLALKIIGLILLALILLGFIALRILAAWLKKAVRTALDATANTPPSRISLVPEPSPEWRSEQIIRDWTAEFERLGFQEIGAFSVPEMAGLLLKGFCHPKEQLYGAIYDHKTIDPTLDIVCCYTDGTSLTATNTTTGEVLEQFPGDQKVRREKGNVTELYEAALQQRKTIPRKPADADKFTEFFQQGYVKEMNWRLKKGGASREEIRRVAEKGEHKLTDEQLEEAYKLERSGYVKRLQEACVAQYLDDSRMPVPDWEKIRHRTFAIPETLEWPEVVETLQCEMGLDEEQQAELDRAGERNGRPVLETLERILHERVGSLRLQKLGAVSEPVVAHVFLAPEDDEHDDSDDGED